MNKDEIQNRLRALAEQEKQVQAKAEEGRNVMASGQKIVEDSNAMMLMIRGAQQDCQFWLQKIADAEAKQKAEEEQAAKAATSDESIPADAD